MMRDRGHVSDDRLIDVCLQGAFPGRDASAAPTASETQHLASCPACDERRSHFAGLLAEAGAVVAAQADAHFTADRLAKQRAHILERLEHEARHGRVITFPAAHGHAPALRVRPGARWIAAAAAAGLLIGFVAEHVTHRVPSLRSEPSALTMADGPEALRLVVAPLSEEEFLGRMELAVEGTAGSALRPLDDLTPRVWEVATQ